MTYVILRYLHLIALLFLSGGVIIENLATKASIDSEDARNLARVDAVCGLSVLLAASFGLTLWLLVGKASSFYWDNPVFHFKLGLFLLLLLAATGPALFYFRHRDFAGDSLEVPSAVRWCLRLELVLLLLLASSAWMMSRGIGLPI